MDEAAPDVGSLELFGVDVAYGGRSSVDLGRCALAEDAVNLVSRSRMRNLTAAGLLGECHAEVPGLLGHPVGGGIGGDAGDPDEERVVVDEEEHIEPPKQHGFDAEEVARDRAVRLSGEELGPGWPRPPALGFDAVALRDRPDARRGDRDAHRGELAVDAPVARGRVLLCQPEDKRSGSRGEWWPAGPAVWVGPAPGDKVSVPAK